MENPALWDNLRAPFIDKLNEASRALEKTRLANDAAVKSELTAIAFEIMANRRRLSLTSDEGEEEEKLEVDEAGDRVVSARSV